MGCLVCVDKGLLCGFGVCACTFCGVMGVPSLLLTGLLWCCRVVQLTFGFGFVIVLCFWVLGFWFWVCNVGGLLLWFIA